MNAKGKYLRGSPARVKWSNAEVEGRFRAEKQMSTLMGTLFYTILPTLTPFAVSKTSSTFFF